MLYAVVDMYGKCAQVTVTAPSTPDSSKCEILIILDIFIYILWNETSVFNVFVILFEDLVKNVDIENR